MEAIRIVGPQTAQLGRRLAESRRRETELAELRARVAATIAACDRLLASRGGSVCGRCHAPIPTTALGCSSCGSSYLADARAYAAPVELSHHDGYVLRVR